MIKMNGMLYHGSKKFFKKLKRRKAWGPSGTPKEESLNMIYLTPQFAFALVSAVRPLGKTEVNHNERTVRFENLDLFEPEEEVYIYVIDSAKIPGNKKTWIDEWQVAVNLDEIKPERVETHKAGEISDWYTIL